VRESSREGSAGSWIETVSTGHPAGIRIALLLEQRTGVTLDSLGMNPAAPRTGGNNARAERLGPRSARAPPGNPRALSRWEAIDRLDAKGEQEVYERNLFQLFAGGSGGKVVQTAALEHVPRRMTRRMAVIFPGRANSRS
jgi:hypothetical protein